MDFVNTLKKEAAPIIDAIYHDNFIQSLLKGDVSKAAIKHYLRADSRYLNEFAKIYALLILKIDSKEEIQFLTEQIQFASSGEVEAHHTLAQYVGEDYNQIIKDGEWYPTADHYIKHMYYNAFAYDHIAYTLAAMAPCPYVYQQIGKRAIKENAVSEDNPLKPWFEFYATEMDTLMDYIDQWFNQYAEQFDTKHQDILKRNFLQSTVHERNFFNMAYNQEKWDFGGELNE
ncbi:thiaminase II [Staphylococcus canis]|uniref:Aminopyrimidine aminohydrolase n=1 Tax=Staphylococcus canis TaxID=2724942 RepID=A0ABS0T9T2_9STAP|nr:thiaminase II [Staphylococcus canis]MBI5975509.1 thiaminase II [Staphylococcus canis]